VGRQLIWLSSVTLICPHSIHHLLYSLIDRNTNYQLKQRNKAIVMKNNATQIISSATKQNNSGQYTTSFEAEGVRFFFEKHSINIDIYICMSTHSYKYTHTHSILMITSERLSRIDLEIHEVGHQKRLTVNRDIVFH
jgi:hypothetical protein